MHKFIYKQAIDTPIGRMVTLATEKGICFLNFEDNKKFEKQYVSIQKLTQQTIIEETIKNIDLLKKELNLYFDSQLKEFSVPIDFIGTDFQVKVWNELRKIPYGKTISYKEQANNLNRPSSTRAVANANGNNKVSIVVPCHRVIGSNGLLTGYAGGTDRKRFLLELESK